MFSCMVGQGGCVTVDVTTEREDTEGNGRIVRRGKVMKGRIGKLDMERQTLQGKDRKARHGKIDIERKG